MTSVRGYEGGTPLLHGSDAERVEELVRMLPQIDLSTLESEAALLQRVDRKYVVPVSTFERLVVSLGDGWRSLDVAERRLFGYSSTYFDTPGMDTYRAHLQRRRRRFKVRVRRYVDSDACMLEVKRKGIRGATVKERTPHPPWSQGELGSVGRTFVENVLRGHAVIPAGPFRPVVTTSNLRATLVSVSTHARLTVDTELRCGWADLRVALRPGFVVLESKAEGLSSAVDRTLRTLGERPVSISKYCIGVSALGLDLPDNPWRRTMRRFFVTSPS